MRRVLGAALAAGLLAGSGAGMAMAGAELLPEGDLAAGELRYAENCVNCHGRTGRGMASFPSIQGREAEYIADRLLSYRAREMVGANSALMFSLSDELTDQQIADLAAFISASFP